MDQELLDILPIIRKRYADHRVLVNKITGDGELYKLKKRQMLAVQPIPILDTEVLPLMVGGSYREMYGGGHCKKCGCYETKYKKQYPHRNKEGFNMELYE
jgi:hypothetical protein